MGNLSVSELLMWVLSSDSVVREKAEKELLDLLEKNRPTLILSLCVEMVDQHKPLCLRKMAGVLLKNWSQRNWSEIPMAFKSQIKDFLLRNLAAEESGIRVITGMVISNIALIELQENDWPELVPFLTSYLEMKEDNMWHVRQKSALKTLGFLFGSAEDDKCLIESGDFDTLMSGVGLCMSSSNSEVRYAALETLSSVLRFAQDHFENHEKRNQIIDIVMSNTNHADDEVKVAAFNCLTMIWSRCFSFYEHSYLLKLTKLTSNAAREYEDPVAMAAIELWRMILKYIIYFRPYKPSAAA